VSTVSKIGTDVSEGRNAPNFRAKLFKKSSVLCREFEGNTEKSVTIYHPPRYNIPKDLNLSFHIVSW